MVTPLWLQTLAAIPTALRLETALLGLEPQPLISAWPVVAMPGDPGLQHQMEGRGEVDRAAVDHEEADHAGFRLLERAMRGRRSSRVTALVTCRDLDAIRVGGGLDGSEMLHG